MIAANCYFPIPLAKTAKLHLWVVMDFKNRLLKVVSETVAALAIDKVGHRSHHYRSGPTTRPQEAKKVKLK